MAWSLVAEKRGARHLLSEVVEVGDGDVSVGGRTARHVELGAPGGRSAIETPRAVRRQRRDRPATQINHPTDQSRIQRVEAYFNTLFLAVSEKVLGEHMPQNKNTNCSQHSPKF